MFQNLRAQIELTTKLSEEEWLYCRDRMRVVSLKSGDFILKPGERADLFAFINKGLIKRYFVNEQGGQSITSFDSDGRIVSDFAALLTNSPAHLFIEAIEDTDALLSDGGLPVELREKFPSWRKAWSTVAEIRYVEESRRTHEFLSKDAKSRYHAFVERHGALVKRIPQKDIAAYIGVTPTSLNRILRSSRGQ
jgi:CRP-like cAMP-binding protein